MSLGILPLSLFVFRSPPVNVYFTAKLQYNSLILHKYLHHDYCCHKKYVYAKITQNNSSRQPSNSGKKQDIMVTTTAKTFCATFHEV